MKHPYSTREDLASALSAAGLDLGDDTVDLLARHLDAVLAANETLNLTAITDPGEAVALHVIDSLVALDELTAAPPGAFADLGSGAGFPGIPLALASGRPATLIESIGKKAAFLRGVVDLLAAPCRIEVRQTRAELMALETPGAFTAVTVRALGVLPSLVELASPLLTADGTLIALKGRLTTEELERGVRAARQVGMEYTGVRSVTLPTGQSRTIVMFRRTDAAPETSVPRRPGRAQRHPLA